MLLQHLQGLTKDPIQSNRVKKTPPHLYGTPYPLNGRMTSFRRFKRHLRHQPLLTRQRLRWLRMRPGMCVVNWSTKREELCHQEHSNFPQVSDLSSSHLHLTLSKHKTSTLVASRRRTSKSRTQLTPSLLYELSTLEVLNLQIHSKKQARNTTRMPVVSCSSCHRTGAKLKVFKNEIDFGNKKIDSEWRNFQN